MRFDYLPGVDFTAQAFANDYLYLFGPIDRVGVPLKQQHVRALHGTFDSKALRPYPLDGVTHQSTC